MPVPPSSHSSSDDDAADARAESGSDAESRSGAAPASASDSIVLRPLPVTRRGYLVGGLFVAVIGVFLVVVGFVLGFSSGTVWLLAVLGVLLVAYGVVVAVRGQTVSVTLAPDAATVRGLLVTTTVPRAGIRRATNKPSLEWTDAAGREHSTRLIALNLGNRAGTAPAVVEHVDAEYERLKAWVRASKR
ncbi:hypothetical protein HII28_10955 [Planctomonas sp. JC2975]|uniref:hypothetical protein n=1 Tax=Planctomonas sp. JC2975 TaxID=2729626 RepID=UPI001473C219|nr:hypothetical protein [Planctomonas sp. JC2975]NNC12394.1 hypothetical protein [Planctomonas sp. JC2975]